MWGYQLSIPTFRPLGSMVTLHYANLPNNLISLTAANKKPLNQMN
jgi:hypothetical protein